MFRFEHIEVLYALGIVPILILGYVLHSVWRKKSVAKLAKANLQGIVLPDVSNTKPLIRFIFLCLAVASMIVAIANPQIGSKLEEVKREGVELMIALDLSNSMTAEDLTPSRLEKSKRAISKLVDRLGNDRIGLVIFGGQAYVQLPITTDYAAAKLFLGNVNTNLIPTQGTNIAAAIETCMSAFDFETPTSKSIIVITDGENHEEKPIELAEEAQELGVVIHTVGMGSEKGAPIPIYKNGKQVGYRKDNEGNTIVTKLNETMLTSLAEAGGGAYIRASNSNDGVNFIFDQINKMEKTEFGSKMYTDYEDRFQYFVAFALVMLVLRLVISSSRSKLWDKMNLFNA